MLRSVLALFLIVLAGCNRPEDEIDLSGTWKISFSDSIEYASRTLDDHSWETISVPGSWTKLRNYTDVAWYRGTFQIPPGFSKENRALQFSGSDADETFLNGEKIGESGSISDADAHAYTRTRLYALPPELLVDGPNTIAIRMRGLFIQNSGLTGTPPRIGDVHAFEQERARSEVRQIAFSAVYFTVALYFFLFFVRLPSLRPHLYFAIFCVAIATYYLCRTALIQDQLGLLEAKRLEYLILYCLPIPGFAFLISHFRIHHRWYTFIYYAAFVAFTYLPLTTRNISAWNQSLGYWQFVMFAGIFLMIAYLIREAIRRNAEARLLLGGTLIFSLAVLNDMMNDRGVLSTPLVASYGFFAFVISMSASLVRSFVELQRTSEQTVQRLLEVDALKERLVTNITDLLLLPAASILAVANRITSTGSQLGLANQYQELQQHGTSLNEVLDGVLLMSRIQSGVEASSFRVLNAPELRSIYTSGDWEDRATILGTESLMRGLFAMPGVGGFSWNGATGLALTIRAWPDTDIAGPLRDNLLREIVGTLKGHLLRRPDGSWLVRIPPHTPDAPWTPGRSGIGTNRALLVRALSGSIVAGSFALLGQWKFAVAIGAYVVLALAFFLLDLKRTGNSWLSRFLQSKISAYFRTLSDVVTVVIALYGTGGIDSPWLVGMVLPCMMSSYGMDRWRGRTAAVVGGLGIIFIELAVSLGLLPDVNVIGGESLHSAGMIGLLSPAIVLTLLIVAETTNRLYSALARKKEESEKRKRYAAKLSEFTTVANATTDLGHLMEQIVSYLQSEFQIDTLILLLPDPTSGDLVAMRTFTAASSGIEIAKKAEKLRVASGPSGGIVRATFERKKPLYIKVSSETPADDSGVSLEDFQVPWFFLVPLVVHSKSIGLILCTSTQRKSLENTEIADVESFCAQISGPVHTSNILQNLSFERDRAENLRNLAEVAHQHADDAQQQSDLIRELAETSAAEAALLAEVSRNALQGLGLSEVLAAVVEALRKRLKANSAALYITDPSAKKLELNAVIVGSAAIDVASYSPIVRSIPLVAASGSLYRTFTRQKPFYTNRITEAWLAGSPVDRAVMKSWPIQWIGQLPLIVHDRVIGIMAFTGPDGKGPGKREMDFIVRLGSQVAGAVQHVKLLDAALAARQDADAARRGTEKLNQFAKALNASNDFTSVIEQIVGFVQSEYQIDSCIMLLPDAANRELVTARSFTFKDVDPAMVDFANALRIPLGENKGIVSRAYTRGKPFYLPVVGRDIFRLPYPGLEIDRDIVEFLKFPWFLILPLLIQGSPVGMLLMTSYSNTEGLKSVAIRALEGFGDQIAGAIHSMSLLNQIKEERDGAESARVEAERERRHTEKLNQISKALNASPDFRGVTTQIVSFLQQEYGIDSSIIMLPEADTGDLVTSQSFAEATADPSVGEYAQRLRVKRGSDGGMIGLTYERKKPLYIELNGPRDIFKNPYPGMESDRAIVQGLKLSWFLLLPLVVNNQSIGMMMVTSYLKPEGPRRKDIRAMHQFADQIAGALNTSNLLIGIQKERDAAERARKEVLALSELVKGLNENLDLHDILRKVWDYMKVNFGVHYHYLYLKDSTKNELRFFSGTYPAEVSEADQLEVQQTRLPLDGSDVSLHYLAYTKQRSVYIPNIRSDSASAVETRNQKFLKMKSLLIVPLVVNNEVIGTLDFSHGSEKMQLTREDRERISTVAEFVAGAIKGSTLFRQIEEEQAKSERARQETEILASLARRANEGQDLDGIIAVLVEILENRFKASTVFLALPTHQDTLEIKSFFQNGVKQSDDSLPFKSLPLDESGGTLYRTFRRKKMLYLSYITEAWNARSKVDRMIFEKLALKWFVQVPLLIEARVVGIFGFSGPESVHLSKEDLGFVSRMASQIAGAVRTSRLLEEAEKSREESDRLLQNVLPASVAKELKEKGQVEPLFYDSVSVLFTDFVGFTQASENMLPDELVAELDGCFSQFDAVSRRNNMEKLKTIGDAYMCAAGLPNISDTHAIDACLTGLEFRSFMMTAEEIKKSLGMDYWQIRIGIHSGPVTAGVIGTNKFAYDIWGDTVNTASRMESSGSPGKVNISGDTYALVKDFFECEYRGKVKAKGKGEVDMYYLLRIKPELSADEMGLLPNAKFELLRTRADGQEV